MKTPALHIPIKRPEEVIPRLGKPDLHWKAGRSAHCLATLWVRANGFPSRVEAVLKKDAQFAEAQFVIGIFERETDLKSSGRPSQTDLLVIAAISGELAAIGVEGKVDEPFGDFVRVWNDRSVGKQRRLTGLCRTLGLDASNCGDLRYQLLHRTAAAIYEAQRFCSRHAVMLVHSFSRVHAGFDDFRAFASALGLPMERPGTLSRAKPLEGVSLRLGWVDDQPPNM